MKIAIMGTGGVGGLFGARLAQAGFDVIFIARGAHLDAITSKGLQVLSADRGDILIKDAQAVSDPKSVGVVDYIFLTVKLWDTESAVDLIRPMVGPKTTVISFQNGISRDDVLKAKLGAEHVLGGISYVGATIQSPGVIEQRGTVQKLVFGEYGGAKTERVLALQKACESAEIEVVVPEDIEKALWEKFVVLVAMSSITASCRSSIGLVRENAETRALLQAVMSEVAAVGKARGVKIADDIVARQMTYLDNLGSDVTASMEHDLRHGNKLELPWLAGTVVTLGKTLNIPTPTCSFVCAILSPYVSGNKC
ncbi:2-dehydropantoate 2-reductase [soil metagenome]